MPGPFSDDIVTAYSETGLFGEKSKNEVEYDPIGGDVKALIQRGNVTLEEYLNIRLNSYEHYALIPAMSDEVFLAYVDNTLKNIREPRKPPTTYDDALYFIAEEARRRLKGKTE